MKTIGGFIFHVFANIVAFLAASYFVVGFKFTGSFLELLITALIFTAINTFIRPIIKLFLGPFIVLTLGLLIIVINAAMLYILDIWSQPLTIEGFKPLFLATLIIGAVNLIVNLGAKTFYKKS